MPDAYDIFLANLTTLEPVYIYGLVGDLPREDQPPSEPQLNELVIWVPRRLGVPPVDLEDADVF
jgi:hypothetical protein